MKKLIVLMLIPILAVALLAGRTGKKTTAAPEPQAAPEQSAPAPQPEEKPAEPAPEAQPETEAPAPEEEAEEEEEENYDTGDAKLDDPLNQDGIGEKELLVVSFGTSFNDNRRLTIGAIEQHLQEAFPDWSVRRAFTSQIIIDHVAKRDGEIIDNVQQALDRAVANGVKVLLVQPTHLMNGFEYTDLKNELAGYADAFDQILLGEPLLTIDRDYDMVAETLVDATAQYDDGETAIVFMGHGTEAESNGVYAKMQTVLSEAGCENYFIGTVEAEPTVQDVLEKVQAGSYRRVVLRPMMIVAGDHANNDMAGDEEDSWKSVLTAAGYDVECVIEGLGQNPDVRALYVKHVQDAIAGGACCVSRRPCTAASSFYIAKGALKDGTDEGYAQSGGALPLPDAPVRRDCGSGDDRRRPVQHCGDVERQHVPRGAVHPDGAGRPHGGGADAQRGGLRLSLLRYGGGSGGCFRRGLASLPGGCRGQARLHPAGCASGRKAGCRRLFDQV